MDQPKTAGSDFDQKKWEMEVRLREREITIKEREQDIKDRDVQAKIDEQKRSRWTNPLVLAVLAAALAAGGNAAVAVINGILQRQLEETRATDQRKIEEAKAEAARILEVIKTNDPDKAAVNLDFLLQAGLIADQDRHKNLSKFLGKRTPGQGPALPALIAESAYLPLDILAHSCEFKGNASSVFERLIQVLNENSPRGIGGIRTVPSPTISGTTMITAQIDPGMLLQVVKVAESGMIHVGLKGGSGKGRSDERIIEDTSAAVEELVPALVRTKLRELAVDPKCVR